MPNIQSAKKRMRSDAKKRAGNQATMSELKTLDQKVKAMTDLASAQPLVRHLISRYDRAVSRGILPRGRADRKKSRLAKYLAKLKK